MTASSARLEAQAKLNLFLRVQPPDASGYHPLETLFCRLALADTLVVSIGGSTKSLDITGPRVPSAGLGPVEQNLAWKAAEAYAAMAGFPDAYEIRIEKRIPVGGGLGGGSADAGGVLRILNALNPHPLAAAELMKLACALGADVPFLTQDLSPLAIGRGYGDLLEMVPPLRARPVWLLVPDVSVNTSDAYGWLDAAASRASPAGVTAEQVANWDAVRAMAINDFEPVVGMKVPMIGRLLSGFRSPELAAVLGDSAIVLMSGSGSTVAVIAGQIAENHWSALPRVAGVDIVETQTASFVEPVVRTH